MTQERGRLYWADTVYDRFDRQKLADLMSQAGHYMDNEELAEWSRSDLIDALIDTQVEAEYDAEEAHEDYPLRRPVRTVVPEWLTGPGRRVHLRWEVAWEPALRRLLEDQPQAEPSTSAADGDLVVTVLGCDPPVLASVELVDDSPVGSPARERMLIAQPVTWHGLWYIAGRPAPRPQDGPLSGRTSAELVEALRRELEEPDPTFLAAGDCTYYRTTPSAIDVLSALQTYHRQGTAPSRCASCDKDGSVTVHFERPIFDNIPLEIQDHLDDVVHLCDDCHRLMHPHSVATQRRSLHAQREDHAPACPTCGAPRAREIVYGLPADPEALDNDDVEFAGCVADGPFPAQWRCRACGDEFATISTTALNALTGALPPRAPRPRPSTGAAKRRRPPPRARDTATDT